MKYDFDKAMILNISYNIDTYNKGEELFKKNRTLQISDKTLRGVKVITFKTSDGLDYMQTLKFELSGKFISHYCTCEANSIWKGGCKHITSALFCLLKNYAKNKVKEEMNTVCEELLYSYKDKVIESLISKKGDRQDSAKVIPEIYLNEGKTYISFYIFLKRKYIIKDISLFLDSIKNSEIVSYSKDVKFNHHFTNFDSDSKKLIKFILREVNINKVFDLELEKKRYIYLSPKAVDEFFNIYRKDSINILKNNDTAEYLINDFNFDFDMQINESVNEVVLSVKNKHDTFFKGDTFYYVMKDNYLYKTEKKYFKTVIPFLSAIEKLKTDEIIFNDIDSFKLIMLPVLIENGLLDLDYMANLKYKFYLDIKNNKVVCKVTDLDENNILYEYSNDNNFISEILRSLGFRIKPNKTFELNGEDEIYDFYYFGLSELKNYGDIFATEDFEKQSYIPETPDFNFEVRIKGDLLEISLDSIDYSLDELLETFKHYNEEKKYYRLKKGKYVDLNNKSFKEAKNLIGDLDVKEQNNNKLTIKKYNAIYIDSLINENSQLKIKTEVSYRKLIYDIKSYNDLNFEIPDNFDNILRDYQKVGFNWLSTLSYYGFGGILADDMGLGKSVQIISLIVSYIKNNEDYKKSIIICPTSLIFNWDNEFKKFAPDLCIDIITGMADKRKEILENSYAHVLIITYDTLKRDIDNFNKKFFKFLIADEAQNIKNPVTQNAKAIKMINSEINFALTGTPIENSLTELWSIFDFVMPGYLLNLSKFNTKYAKPIVKDEDRNYMLKLKNKISPFILRREKKDVLTELPDKIETNIFAEMTEEQKKIYSAYLLEARGELDSLKNNQIKILSMLTRLRQICCEPSLFLENYKGGSGKLEATLEIIEQSLESKHRILLFSQFTSMLDIIKEKLKKQKIEYFYLDGKVNSKERMEMTTNFNEGQREVFLISLKAGGTGLNLTGADVVIHYDPWWNPAVMEQATDRAYRIGQEKAVQVINIIAKDTIEEKIIVLQEKKKHLINNVLEEGSNFINKMTKEELEELFKQ